MATKVVPANPVFLPLLRSAYVRGTPVVDYRRTPGRGLTVIRRCTMMEGGRPSRSLVVTKTPSAVSVPPEGVGWEPNWAPRGFGEMSWSCPSSVGRWLLLTPPGFALFLALNRPMAAIYPVPPARGTELYGYHGSVGIARPHGVHH